MTVLLRAERVSKAFGGVQALDNCSIEVEQGTISGLIGPNGSGKTTLFNIITGYERVDAGDVYLSGVKITNSPPARVYNIGLGRTFQITRIFPRLTVLENMLIAAQHGRQDAGRGRARNPLGRAGGTAERGRAMELLEFTGIAGHETALAGTLSYGQRKLLELSYVLVTNPAIVLLDERWRREPFPDQPHQHEDQGAEQARYHVSCRRAQHGIRDGSVPSGHCPRLRHGSGGRSARDHQDRSPGSGRIPGDGGGRR